MQTKKNYKCNRRKCAPCKMRNMKVISIACPPCMRVRASLSSIGAIHSMYAVVLRRQCNLSCARWCACWRVRAAIKGAFSVHCHFFCYFLLSVGILAFLYYSTLSGFSVHPGSCLEWQSQRCTHYCTGSSRNHKSSTDTRSCDYARCCQSFGRTSLAQGITPRA